VINRWPLPSTWPAFDPPGFVFLARGAMAVGKTMYPADWSGEELAIEPVERLPPGGSNTVQDLHSTGIPNAHGTLGRVLLHTVFDAVGIMSGEHLFGGAGGGVAGGVIGTMGGEMSNDIRMAGITRVNDLVTRALLEPDVAKALLQRIPANGKVTPQSPPGRALLHALAVGTVGSMVPSRSDNRRPPMLPPVSGSRSKGYTPPPMRLTPVSQAPHRRAAQLKRIACESATTVHQSNHDTDKATKVRASDIRTDSGRHQKRRSAYCA
jgi:hypothetical protein